MVLLIFLAPNQQKKCPNLGAMDQVDIEFPERVRGMVHRVSREPFPMWRF